jgi:hypothetical protein
MINTINCSINPTPNGPLGHSGQTGNLRTTRHRDTARVGWMFALTAAACNLVRLPKLLAAA